MYLISAVFSVVVGSWSAVNSAPYAAVVMDARTGKIYHSRNADTRLHPASLTKMMTLYVAFQAIEQNEISLDSYVTVSRNASSEPPSKLWLKRGQKIQLRYLIRAASVKSANDAATAIGEAISGSEAAFAKRMTQTARAMGMNRTTFKNAHGLTRSGHLSTARDMTLLGRHMIYDYPQYYNLFSRRSANAKIRQVNNTNRKFLAAYKGADGIKTGYTRAAGFNLVASAERGGERIIATMFGGSSTAARNNRVAKLLDMGFKRAPSTAKLQRPSLPPYNENQNEHKGKTVHLMTAVKRSLRPKVRPFALQTTLPETLIASTLEKQVQPEDILIALQAATSNAVTVQLMETTYTSGMAAVSPRARPHRMSFVAEPVKEQQTETVARRLISGSRTWAINVGEFDSRLQAERVLLRMALAEMSTLDGANRTVKTRSTGYDALFTGLTRDSADLVCRRLHAQQLSCYLIAPS
ncbi:MAG TPA: D-alanyl-D-alanine carboxypeptidase [Rhodobacteraceae bacterium]|nr:D-alanyl-D-alanine carboxypeptidase [Paracoccaceae bacterium]|tara:strand:+ start:180 stop:1580 length:1401 start_codon:yes stop_codon:yes gene_type:complete